MLSAKKLKSELASALSSSAGSMPVCATGTNPATNVEATATAGGRVARLRVGVCVHFALWTPLRYGMGALERIGRAL